jgi:hypothetical protein
MKTTPAVFSVIRKELKKCVFPLLEKYYYFDSNILAFSIAFLSKVPGAGFEPAKLYAEDLESTPFDRSGTPACC